LFTFRKAGAQVSPVTMSHPSPRTTIPPCLPLDIKDPLKEDTGFLLWAFCFGAFALGLFALGFLLEAFAVSFWALSFWLFDVGGFGREKDC
jgi:hypothetical protein